MNEDYLVCEGGGLKSLSDSGKVGGFLVLFDEIDLTQEYFPPNCDFWLEGKSFLPLIYDHGRSPVFGKKKLTHMRVETQDSGVWVEGRLPIRESAAIEQLWESVKRDELGLSSGTSGHLAERVPRERGVAILTWPILEASLARRPAQPKSRAIALKSLPLSDFKLLNSHQQQLKQRAMKCYVESLMRGIELNRQELERSMIGDSKQEEQAYYNALAELEMQKFELMRRR